MFYIQQINFLMVDIETNPLYYASIGGIILAISTSLHYVLKGNVTGISGIIYDVAFFNTAQLPNKLIIIGGIIMASGIFFDIFQYGTYNKFTPFGPKQLISQHTSYLGYALAGFLVGFGTKLGNGCTSGHGLCGLPRLSIRSYVAVGTFLTSAIGIATIKYYLTLGPFSQNLSPYVEYDHLISANLCIVFGVAFLIIGFIIEKLYNKPTQLNSVIIRDNLISLLVGLLFGAGLVVSGMVRRRNILQFLWMGKDWNPSLLFVLGCAVIINLIVFNYMIRLRKVPIFGQKLFNPDNSVIDWKLLLGACSFGIGWGIGGICPGPALALLPVFQVQIHIIWIGCLVIGMFVAAKLSQYSQKKEQKTPQPVTQTKHQTKVDNSSIENLIAAHKNHKLQHITKPPVVKVSYVDNTNNLNNEPLQTNKVSHEHDEHLQVINLDQMRNQSSRVLSGKQSEKSKTIPHPNTLLNNQNMINYADIQEQQSSNIKL